MMVNKQMRQLRITPYILSAPPPIRCLGHPAVRPDVPPEGSRLYRCEAARARLWASKHGSLVGIKWPALVTMSAFFLFSSVKPEKQHHSGDEASPPVIPTSRGFKPCTSSPPRSPARSLHLLSHLLSLPRPPECPIKNDFRQRHHQRKLEQALSQNAKIHRTRILPGPDA